MLENEDFGRRPDTDCLVSGRRAIADLGERDRVPDEEPEVMTEQMTRSALGSILDELVRLPADAFADRSRVQSRQFEHRRLL